MRNNKLTGYIKRAKKDRYYEDAHYALVASQSVMTEAYSLGLNPEKFESPVKFKVNVSVFVIFLKSPTLNRCRWLMFYLQTHISRYPAGDVIYVLQAYFLYDQIRLRRLH